MKILAKMYMILATIMNLILAYWSNANNFTGTFWFNICCAVFLLGCFIWFGMKDAFNGKGFWS